MEFFSHCLRSGNRSNRRTLTDGPRGLLVKALPSHALLLLLPASVIVFLSLYGGSAAQQQQQQNVLDYCSLEALDTNVSMVLASMTSWGRSFQSLMVLGRNEYCWYWVLRCGCDLSLKSKCVPSSPYGLCGRKATLNLNSAVHYNHYHRGLLGVRE